MKVDNLHRTYIDELVRPNPDDPTGKSMMRRIPDVFDCWFESPQAHIVIKLRILIELSFFCTP